MRRGHDLQFLIVRKNLLDNRTSSASRIKDVNSVASVTLGCILASTSRMVRMSRIGTPS